MPPVPHPYGTASMADLADATALVALAAWHCGSPVLLQQVPPAYLGQARGRTARVRQGAAGEDVACRPSGHVHAWDHVAR
jgi:hypothetical protein